MFEADGTYYAMYTGFNRDYPAQGRPSQVLMVATSTDLVTWTKTGRSLVAPQPGYDQDDWRDPFVLWDEDAQRYLMILGARTDEDGKILTGRTVSFTSTDLESWDFDGDFWAPGLYSMHEMPDLFRMGDRWYLLTTEYSDRSKTVYRMSESLRARGRRRSTTPSTAAPTTPRGPPPTATGASCSAGWRPRRTRTTRSPGSGAARWSCTRSTSATTGHSASGRPTPSLASFGPPRHLLAAPVTVGDGHGLAEIAVCADSGDPFRWETTLRFEPGTRSFALRLFEDPVTGDGYVFQFDVGEQRLVFDRRPNYPWNRYDNKGLERPLSLRPDVDHTIQVIADDTIATVYVDGVALNARMYAKAGTSLAVQVIDGTLVIDSSVLRSRPA